MSKLPSAATPMDFGLFDLQHLDERRVGNRTKHRARFLRFRTQALDNTRVMTYCQDVAMGVNFIAKGLPRFSGWLWPLPWALGAAVRDRWWMLRH